MGRIGETVEMDETIYIPFAKIFCRPCGLLLTMMNIEVSKFITILSSLKKLQEKLKEEVLEKEVGCKINTLWSFLESNLQLLIYLILILFIIFYFFFSMKYQEFFNIISASILLLGAILLVSNKITEDSSKYNLEVKDYCFKVVYKKDKGGVNDEVLFKYKEVDELVEKNNYGLYTYKFISEFEDFEYKEIECVNITGNDVFQEDYISNLIGEKLFSTSTSEDNKLVKTFSLLFFLSFAIVLIISCLTSLIGSKKGSKNVLVIVSAPIILFKVINYIFNYDILNIYFLMFLITFIIIVFISLKFKSFGAFYSLIISSIISSIGLVFILASFISNIFPDGIRFEQFSKAFFVLYFVFISYSFKTKGFDSFCHFYIPLCIILIICFSIIVNLIINIPKRIPKEKRPSTLKSTTKNSLIYLKEQNLNKK